MKLAEALQERADINKKISELKRRLENCLLVQEGEEPAEDPMVLLNELDSATDRLEKLMASINETNCNTKANGMSLTEIIARKDALSIRYSAYKELVYTAGNNTYRARGSEIKVKAVVKAAELQKTVDKLAKEIRLLDNLYGIIVPLARKSIDQSIFCFLYVIIIQKINYAITNIFLFKQNI